MTTAIPFLLSGLGIYLAIGFLFAVAFAFSGVRKIDPAAAKAGVGFKLLIIPGSAIFWPILLLRWIKGTAPPTETSAHRKAAAPQ